jgi:hypothetical protein
MAYNPKVLELKQNKGGYIKSKLLDFGTAELADPKLEKLQVAVKRGADKEMRRYCLKAVA